MTTPVLDSRWEVAIRRLARVDNHPMGVTATPTNGNGLSMEVVEPCIQELRRAPPLPGVTFTEDHVRDAVAVTREYKSSTFTQMRSSDLAQQLLLEMCIRAGSRVVRSFQVTLRAIRRGDALTAFLRTVSNYWRIIGPQDPALCQQQQQALSQRMHRIIATLKFIVELEKRDGDMFIRGPLDVTPPFLGPKQSGISDVTAIVIYDVPINLATAWLREVLKLGHETPDATWCVKHLVIANLLPPAEGAESPYVDLGVRATCATNGVTNWIGEFSRALCDVIRRTAPSLETLHLPSVGMDNRCFHNMFWTILRVDCPRCTPGHHEDTGLPRVSPSTLPTQAPDDLPLREHPSNAPDADDDWGNGDLCHWCQEEVRTVPLDRGAPLPFFAPGDCWMETPPDGRSPAVNSPSNRGGDAGGPGISPPSIEVRDAKSGTMPSGSFSIVIPPPRRTPSKGTLLRLRFIDVSCGTWDATEANSELLATVVCRCRHTLEALCLAGTSVNDRFVHTLLTSIAFIRRRMQPPLERSQQPPPRERPVRILLADTSVTENAVMELAQTSLPTFRHVEVIVRSQQHSEFFMHTNLCFAPWCNANVLPDDPECIMATLPAQDKLETPDFLIREAFASPGQSNVTTPRDVTPSWLFRKHIEFLQFCNFTAAHQCLRQALGFLPNGYIMSFMIQNYQLRAYQEFFHEEAERYLHVYRPDCPKYEPPAFVASGVSSMVYLSAKEPDKVMKLMRHRGDFFAEVLAGNQHFASLSGVVRIEAFLVLTLDQLRRYFPDAPQHMIDEGSATPRTIESDATQATATRAGDGTPMVRTNTAVFQPTPMGTQRGGGVGSEGGGVTPSSTSVAATLDTASSVATDGPMNASVATTRQEGLNDDSHPSRQPATSLAADERGRPSGIESNLYFIAVMKKASGSAELLFRPSRSQERLLLENANSAATRLTGGVDGAAPPSHPGLFARISSRQLVSLVCQVVATFVSMGALGACHSDMKPANVLIYCKRDAKAEPSMDLPGPKETSGVAEGERRRLVESSRPWVAVVTDLAFSGVVNGVSRGFTRLYAAPEVLRGHYQGTTQRDVFAVACFVLDMFSAVPCAAAGRLRDCWPTSIAFDPQVIAHIGPCFYTDPARRPTLEVAYLHKLEGIFGSLLDPRPQNTAASPELLSVDEIRRNNDTFLDLTVRRQPIDEGTAAAYFEELAAALGGPPESFDWWDKYVHHLSAKLNSAGSSRQDAS